MWKLQSLFETHASQVSMQLRRPISSIQSHLREMKSHRFKPLNRVIENYKYETVMSSNEKQKYDHAFKRFMSFEDEEYNKFYKKVFTDFVDLIAYKDFKTEVVVLALYLSVTIVLFLLIGTLLFVIS